VVRHSPSSEDEGCVLVSGKSGNLTGPVFYTKAPKPVIARPLWTPKKVARAVDPRNWKRIFLPEFVDDRSDLVLHEATHILQESAFRFDDALYDRAEVAVRTWKK
jgi:hypothetical protein